MKGWRRFTEQRALRRHECSVEACGALTFTPWTHGWLWRRTTRNVTEALCPDCQRDEARARVERLRLSYPYRFSAVPPACHKCGRDALRVDPQGGLLLHVLCLTCGADAFVVGPVLEGSPA